MLLARAACATHSRTDVRDAQTHLSKGDAAIATRDCAVARKTAGSKHARPEGTEPAEPRASSNGAPILE